MMQNRPRVLRQILKANNLDADSTLRAIFLKTQNYMRAGDVIERRFGVRIKKQSLHHQGRRVGLVPMLVSYEDHLKLCEKYGARPKKHPKETLKYVRDAKNAGD